MVAYGLGHDLYDLVKYRVRLLYWETITGNGNPLFLY